MIKDLSGQIFNRWTVIGPPSLGGKNGTTVFWICRCECGTVKPVASGHLKNGASASNIGDDAINRIIQELYMPVCLV